MRDPVFYANGLLELHALGGAIERRAAWRQSMAALGRATAEEGPGPLDGLHPAALLSGVRVALNAGLVDDLDWLAPAAAGTALYELASALPLGAEQRELGRRVFARLVAADAGTFVAIARRMVLGTGKGLGSAGMRARVALVTELPIAVGVADGPLALAIASRRELSREWIGLPSTGSLSSRRLAARLLERAAREAARRAAYGDLHGLRAFGSSSVAPAWERLLADRESLVWRHVAVARGLLAPWVPELAGAMEAAVDPLLSATEWRRAAASVAANVAVAPESALALARRALTRGLLERDPGAAAAFLWGLPRAAETEPKAAEQLLDWVFERAGWEIAEATVELRVELGDEPLAQRAARRALTLLSGECRGASDDGEAALARELARDLEGGSGGELRHHVANALLAFATTGAKAAHGRALEAVDAARRMVDALETKSLDEEEADGIAGEKARRASLAILRDLDVSLLERDALAQLLLLGGGGDAARSAREALDPIHERLGAWILAREHAPLVASSGGVGNPRRPILSLRRLRALLHLVDSDMEDDDSDPQRALRLRALGLRSVRALLGRFERGPPSPLRRTVVAALARGLDALVRVGACDLVDALLVVARHVVDPIALDTLAEAAMVPDLVHALRCYARFVCATKADVLSALPSYDELARDLVADSSGRMEVLRTVLVRLGNALGAIHSATSLRALSCHGEPEAVTQLELSLASLGQLANGARARFDPDRAPVSHPPMATRPLAASLVRVLSGADPSLSEPVVARALDELLVGVPRAIGLLVSAIVWRLVELPLEGPPPRAGSLPATNPSVRAMVEALPAWVPARRTLGGFYLLRALSAGAVGSVFVVTRDEDRGDVQAERLALKVPEYSAGAARHLSEVEFLKMFREEASTLIALPQHPNLARFVTFDAGSKPKPILVMELVEGVTLERLLESRDVDLPRAFRVLDDILAGLEAMHDVGVGHLDLKPSNVVLRRGEEAVLVDFGLAGRHVRPGCATGPYGAPEVWGALNGSEDISPAKADIYAFGCMAFETLVGEVLFDAASEIAQVTLHVGHDGFPAPLRALADRGGAPALVELLVSTLRQNPKDRPSSAAVRRELSRIAPTFARGPWPIGRG